MNQEARQARERLKLAEMDLTAAKGHVDHIERTCERTLRHTFTEPESKPIVTPGYYAEADLHHPGGPGHKFWVPEVVKPRWIRTCTTCGKVEETTQATEQVTKTLLPQF